MYSKLKIECERQNVCSNTKRDGIAIIIIISIITVIHCTFCNGNI